MHFDLSQTAPGIAYKLLVATVMPRPIAWVVTQSPQGLVNVAPFSFFNVMGDEPPTVVLGISPGRDGGLKHSAQNIAASGEFVVNLVPFALAGAMNLTSIDAPEGVSEAELAGLDLVPSVKVAPPPISATLRRLRLSSAKDTAPAWRSPRISKRVNRLRNSGGKDNAVSARAAPAAKVSLARTNSRSIPAGSSPRAITSASAASRAGRRSAVIWIRPSTNVAGRKTITGRGLWDKVTAPRACNAARKPARSG